MKRSSEISIRILLHIQSLLNLPLNPFLSLIDLAPILSNEKINANVAKDVLTSFLNKFISLGIFIDLCYAWLSGHTILSKFVNVYPNKGSNVFLNCVFYLNIEGWPRLWKQDLFWWPLINVSLEGWVIAWKQIPPFIHFMNLSIVLRIREILQWGLAFFRSHDSKKVQIWYLVGRQMLDASENLFKHVNKDSGKMILINIHLKFLRVTTLISYSKSSLSQTKTLEITMMFSLKYIYSFPDVAFILQCPWIQME